MYLNKFAAVLLIAHLFSCNPSSRFDSALWIKHPQAEDNSNPRAGMVNDLMKNKLKPGMSKEEVLELLGKPYKEGIEQRLPKNIVIPDSISFSNPDNLKPENLEKIVTERDTFNKLHAKPVFTLHYPVGWSTIDPNFLVIIMNENGLVERYQVEQS